jgi:hypothetical protein
MVGDAVGIACIVALAIIFGLIFYFNATDPDKPVNPPTVTELQSSIPTR